LTLFGGVLAYTFSKDHSLSKEEVYLLLLILPWVSLIMGWTYLVNDEKISAIGQYVRNNLSKKLAPYLGIDISKLENPETPEAKAILSEIESIFGWEIVHRNDERREYRKIEQLIIDEITFVLSGIGALIGFHVMTTNPTCLLQILWGFEFILLLVLGVEIVIYTDCEFKQVIKSMLQRNTAS
jgi:hypothetical protein